MLETFLQSPQIVAFTGICNVGGDGNIAEDEVLSESWSDGAGRVRLSRSPHTFNTDGTTATWAGSVVEYDLLGQVKRQSVPTEINSSWNPTGDDYRGMSGNDYIWLWNSKEYDWKGRVTRTVPSDSTGSDGKDTLITYDGCGCAGGQVGNSKR